MFEFLSLIGLLALGWVRQHPYGFDLHRAGRCAQAWLPPHPLPGWALPGVMCPHRHRVRNRGHHILRAGGARTGHRNSHISYMEIMQIYSARAHSWETFVKKEMFSVVCLLFLHEIILWVPLAHFSRWAPTAYIGAQARESYYKASGSHCSNVRTRPPP